MNRSENNNFLNIDDFEMNYAGVFFGKLKNLKIFKQKLNELAEKHDITVRYQDINRDKLWIKRGGGRE